MTDFIKGKWYTVKGQTFHRKAIDFNHGLEYSELISPAGKHQFEGGNCMWNREMFILSDMEIIKQCLPLNHPDRKSNKVDTTDYKYLTPLLKKLNIT